MNKKLTWEEIYKDFRSKHPTLRKLVMHWHPLDYVTIKIYFTNGMTGSYNYMDHQLKFM